MEKKSFSADATWHLPGQGHEAYLSFKLLLKSIRRSKHRTTEHGEAQAQASVPTREASLRNDNS